MVLAAACPSQNDALDAKFNQATLELNERNYGKARTYLIEAEELAGSPHEHSEIQYRKAEVYEEEGRLSKAAQAFELAARFSVNPNRKARSLLEASHLWLKLNQRQKALAGYLKIYLNYPDSSAALSAAIARVELLKSPRSSKSESIKIEAWREIYKNCRSRIFCEESRYQLARSLEGPLNNAQTVSMCNSEVVLIYTELEQSPAKKNSALLDDIRIRLALIQRECGEIKLAIRLFKTVGKRPSSSWVMGTYDTASGAEAYYLLAETLREYADQTKEAAQIWRGPALYHASINSPQKSRQALACQLLKEVPPEYERWYDCVEQLCQGTKPQPSCQRRPSSLRGRVSRQP